MEEAQMGCRLFSSTRFGCISAVALLMFLAGGHQTQAQTAGGQSGSSGYIDDAVPTTMLRLRVDSAFDNNRPDRAEFFYSQYQQQLIGAPGGVLYVNTPPSGHVAVPGDGKGKGKSGDLTFSQPGDLIGNPNARGLPRPETRVDFQDLTAYGEWAIDPRFSVFVEAPWEFLQAQQNGDFSGYADMNAGFKWAFIYNPDLVVSFQLRTFIPTGDSTQGLGTNHVSLEPALLLNEKLTDRLTMYAELRDWIPIGGTDFQGNVVRYGLGFGYLAYQNDMWSITPVVEGVGWTVLSGKETVPITPTLFQIQDAAGASIFNLKVGARVRFGEHSDIYVGYGRALTGDVWYKDIVRVEYRLSF
jgi:hypothetical protein